MADILVSKIQVPSLPNDNLILKDAEARDDLSTALATLTGNPLNFSTRSAQKANQTVISLVPIQDLHGYDHPWPEGGGKNKLPMTVDGIKAANTSGTWSGNVYTHKGISYTIQTDDGNNIVGIVVNGTCESSESLLVLYDWSTTILEDLTSYVLNGCAANGSIRTYSIYVNNTTSGSGNDYVNDYGTGVAFTTKENHRTVCRISVRPNITVSNLLFQPMIRLATETDATFAPYSNYCPITGHTEVSVEGCGKNQAVPINNAEYYGVSTATNTQGITSVSGTATGNGGRLVLCSDPFVLSAGTYTISHNGNGTWGTVLTLSSVTTQIILAAVYNNQTSVTFSLEEETNVVVGINVSAGNTYSGTVKPQIELGTQPTAYEPYVESNDLTIQFGEKVYGATVELESGTVTVDREIVDMGTLEYIPLSGGRFQATISDFKQNGDAICSIAQKVASTSSGEEGFSVYLNSVYIHISPYESYTVSDFKTAVTGQTLCYELATPRTIQLTPNEISLLSGVNVISSNADGISLTYRDGKVATLGDLDSLNVALNDALQDTATDLSDDITTAQNTANTALAYAQNNVYGMRIRESVESNPASIISYLADAVGMTPVHMDYTNNVFDYGSWEDAWFIKDCKPCILGQDGIVQAYLNKNDYTKDIYGNTVTIDENLTGANVMIEFPKIWYKIVPVVPTCCDADVYFSPVKLDDDYKDFAYIAKDKTHKEHFYMPAYNGSIVNDGTNDVLRSLSGQAVGNSKTGTVEIEMAQRNGTGWYTETFSQVTLINLLLMLIGKSTDTQTVFGRGIDTGSQTAFNAYRTGAGNTKGMFWGSNDGTQLVKVFGIENWWSLQWRRFAGLILSSGTWKYKMCWGQEDGSTTDNYNTDADGYVTGSAAMPSGTSGDYITRLFFSNVNMIPTKTGATASTKYCDGLWYNNSNIRYALRGGDSPGGAICGAFALYVGAAVSRAYWNHGAALSYT